MAVRAAGCLPATVQLDHANAQTQSATRTELCSRQQTHALFEHRCYMYLSVQRLQAQQVNRKQQRLHASEATCITGRVPQNIHTSKRNSGPCLQEQHVTLLGPAHSPEHTAESSSYTVLQEQQAKRQRSAHISDHHRMTSALDKCPFCFGSAARARHLTISLGQCSYLALPARCSVLQNTSGRFALIMLTCGPCAWPAQLPGSAFDLGCGRAPRGSVPGTQLKYTAQRFLTACWCPQPDAVQGCLAPGHGLVVTAEDSTVEHFLSA